MLNRKGHCDIRPKPIYQQKTLIKKAKPVLYIKKNKKIIIQLINGFTRVHRPAMPPVGFKPTTPVYGSNNHITGDIC